MGFFDRFFGRKKPINTSELVKPFSLRAKQALLKNDLGKAIAYLDSGIKVAPEGLQLYLERAQIFQYGFNNYSKALKDYRFILRKLESSPDNPMADKCREAMRDMMQDSESTPLRPSTVGHV